MLHLLPSPKTKQKAKQLGRGMGTGVGGHTVGRGLKGATARSGYKAPRPGFEGGQNPISRRLPKLKGIPKNSHGFTSGKTLRVKKLNSPVKLSVLAERADETKTKEIKIQTLIDMGLVSEKSTRAVMPKVLFDKDITSPLTLDGVKTSKRAKEAIESAGGIVK